ncbi:hypothetical protein [Zobellia laminariae]|uniref:hypothetical protein n=1 Tax=Zobellia laminariae TaxID=248906 RepID=UPI0026F41470|nr:hypothetical protein [Zobellia laminariae]WKX75194.1 hypothetical protein Q5W13_15945 [Zobellia laminariae]
MVDVTYNSDLHFEHTLWTSELTFWGGELKSLENRLNELISHWTDKEVLTKLEHYLDEFNLQSNIVRDIQKSIQQHEINILDHTPNGSESMDIPRVKEHLKLRHKMEAQRETYGNLKKEFFLFSSENL